MWIKYPIIFLLFYFFTLFQASFFLHFRFLGPAPDLVFIFFFLLAYFSPQEDGYFLLFYAIWAGFLLDIILNTFFGFCIALLIAVGFLTGRAKIMLSEAKGKNLALNFLILFLIFFIFFKIFIFNPFISGFGLNFLYQTIYNMALAGIGFYFFKKFDSLNNSGGKIKQLKLFK